MTVHVQSVAPGTDFISSLHAEALIASCPTHCSSPDFSAGLPKAASAAICIAVGCAATARIRRAG